MDFKVAIMAELMICGLIMSGSKTQESSDGDAFTQLITETCACCKTFLTSLQSDCV